MIDREAIFSPFLLALDMLVSYLVKLLSPLQIWMLECGSSSLCDIANDNLGVVILKNAQQAYQSGVASRLPRETQSGERLVQRCLWWSGQLTWLGSEKV